MPKKLENKKIQKIRDLRALGRSIDAIYKEMDDLNVHVSRGAIHKIAKSWDSLSDEKKKA